MILIKALAMADEVEHHQLPGIQQLVHKISGTHQSLPLPEDEDCAEAAR